MCSIEWLCYRWLWWHLITQIAPISTFCFAFHIFILGEHRHFKLGGQVDHSKSQPIDDKLFLKGAQSLHVTHFTFLIPLKISLEWQMLKTLSIVYWLPIWAYIVVTCHIHCKPASYSYYRLKEPLLHSLWGRVAEGFSVITSQYLNGPGCNLEYKWGDKVCTHTKNWGKSY